MTAEVTRPRDRTAARLARHAAWYGAAGVLGKVGALLAVPYLTRQLGPDGYGLADLATSFAAVLVLLVRFGADIPTMRLAAAEPSSRSKFYAAYVTGTALTSIGCAIALLPASALIATAFWSSPDEVGVASLSLLLVPASAIQFALLNVLRFAERPRAYALMAAVDLFGQLGLAVLFVALGWGAGGVIAGYVVGSTLGMVAAAVAALPFLGRAIDLSLTRRILGEGLPFVPGAAAFFAADSISRVATASVLGVAAVGEIALAIRIASVMSLASLAFQLAWGPYGLGLQPGPAAREVLDRVVTALVGLLAASAIALGAVAPELTLIAGGIEFADAASLVPGLLVSAGMPAVLYLFTTGAGILRRGYWVGASALTGATIQVVSTVLLLHVLGLQAFVAGALVGRISALLILSRGVTDAVRISMRAMTILAFGIAASWLLQFSYASAPMPTLLRVTIALMAALAGAGLVVRWGRQLT